MTRIVLERNLKGKEKSLLDTAFPEGRLAFVFDPQTYVALGRRVVSALPVARGEEILLDTQPQPTEALVIQIRAKAAECVAYVAIGSGTINDLCKRAAFLDGKPYAVFATAPSMNGYVSANASLCPDSAAGPAVKTSFPAAAPAWLFGDLEVLANAPLRLIRSGLGDSICRSTAQADWLLSHLLLDTPYDTRPFALLTPYEEALFQQSARLCNSDVEAIETLMRTLIASGEGMTLAGGSYPASQGEHMIAHAYELLAHQSAWVIGAKEPETYHGELIAVTTLDMAALQETMLEHPSPSFIHPSWFDDRDIYGFFGGEVSGFLKQYKAKSERILSRLDVLAEKWKDAASALPHIMRPRTQLQEVLEAVGVSITPASLGLREDHYTVARYNALYTRERFTFLDIEGMFPLLR
jgi:glycerol-1-phosphate dehydrogenase [NAD(P)+]